MSSLPNNDSESSLPKHQPASSIFPSSPPIIQDRGASFENLLSMDSPPRSKSDPPVTQDDKNAKPTIGRVGSEETERPPSAQQHRHYSDEHADDNDDSVEEMIEDPEDKIADFDWEALHQRYHDAMHGCQENEAELSREWESLMSYFRVWADSGNEHETDRTFQRLQTRTAYVHHSEAKLEKTQNHYINVVKAFESALNLLKVHGFGG
ncbi:hypothetical protein GQ44DRAFT_696392 [Phaeosphaeriaceae sp. PMI808]|nr:hypothetical protein GQ44DRAFT_696392 [Phaeosphaeriaceae sp. PMI808]